MKRWTDAIASASNDDADYDVKRINMKNGREVTGRDRRSNNKNALGDEEVNERNIKGDY